MRFMRWEFVPLVGLVVAFARHVRVTRKRSGASMEEVWSAFDRYHIALATTVIPAVAALFTLRLLVALGFIVLT